MDSTTIAATKGGDAYVFDYAHLDVAYTVTLGAGSWGLYQASSAVVVGQTLTPQIGVDGVTSMGGSYTTSISLAHLSTYTSARVHYDGQGFTLEYTLDNGTSWHALAQDGAVTLPANADLDLRVTFPGSIANDPAVLTSLTVYILRTETMKTLKHIRPLTFHHDPMTDNGMVFGSTSAVISAADETTIVDPGDPTTPTGATDYKFGTVEMWITPTTNNVFVSGPAGTIYTNGVAGSPLAGIKQHVVLVLTTKANTALTLVPNCTVSHLAFYAKQMTANDVLSLYVAQSGSKILSIDGGSVITVTESTPATDIYAYAWSIQSG